METTNTPDPQLVEEFRAARAAMKQAQAKGHRLGRAADRALDRYQEAAGWDGQTPAPQHEQDELYKKYEAALGRVKKYWAEEWPPFIQADSRAYRALYGTGGVDN